MSAKTSAEVVIDGKVYTLKAVIRIRSFIRLKIRLCLTHSVFQRQEA